MTEQQAAADYIMQFATNVEQLNIALMNFINRSLEIHGGTEVSDAQREAMQDTINNLRGFAILCSIQMKAIGSKLAIKAEVDDHVAKFKYTYMPETQDISVYVDKVNLFLVNNVMQSILETSLQLADKVSK